MKYIENKYKKISDNMKQAGVLVELEAKSIVAIDTGDLQSSIQTFPVERKNEIFSVEIGTKTIEYAEIIELGRGFPVNYHRNQSVIFTDSGDGLQFMTRATEKLTNSGDIINTIFQ